MSIPTCCQFQFVLWWPLFNATKVILYFSISNLNGSDSSQNLFTSISTDATWRSNKSNFSDPWLKSSLNVENGGPNPSGAPYAVLREFVHRGSLGKVTRKNIKYICSLCTIYTVTTKENVFENNVDNLTILMSMADLLHILPARWDRDNYHNIRGGKIHGKKTAPSCIHCG